jgi:hypothetical protein
LDNFIVTSHIISTKLKEIGLEKGSAISNSMAKKQTTIPIGNAKYGRNDKTTTLDHWGRL